MIKLLPIRQALISVFDKSKILNFAQSLSAYKVLLLSTEGTAQILSDHGLSVCKISDYTKFPEIMNGRIKTLHHKIYAGILNRTDLDDSIMNKYHIQPIDMIIVNFYPFHKILQNTQSSQEEILEYIDIGGPSMVRAAAKNYKNTVIVTDHQDYNDILNEMNQNNGLISLNTRFNLAVKALKYIVKYDTDISNYFSNTLNTYINKPNININKHKKLTNDDNFPDTLECMHLKFTKKQKMRYGENPHQKAVLYQEINTLHTTNSVVNAQQLQGKSLSYNNIIDMNTALECVNTFNQPTCVIVKHTNPCSVSTSYTIAEAYKNAYQSDPISAFGGIIALNRNLDITTTQSILDNRHFIEAIIAPDINPDCLNILYNNKKKDIRILRTGTWKHAQKQFNIDLKYITGGLLIQEQDMENNPKNLKTVTIYQPTQQEIQDALFCWKIVKFVKSNAIVCAKNLQTTGIGSGQTNRINAVKIATTSTNLNNTHKLKGSSMASDAFFPFPDAIHLAAKMGIRCIIQPGGSIKDTEIINTANQYKISMIFTHTRHFRH